ncbi:MAG: hypothetical protein ACYC6A_03345 [Armatimonadota bacterium]
MLNIGWATRDFTPDRPALLQGQMHVRVATEALDPLTLTCLAIEGDGDCALLISADMPFCDESLHAEVRRRLAVLLPEVPAEKIVMGATHTHTSLVYMDEFYPHPGGEVMTGQECFDLIADRTVEVAEAAWQARAPHKVARGFGHAVVAHNRRAVYTDGHAQMYGSTNRPDFDWIEGYEDHSVDMLFTWDAAGTLDGMLVNVPCPSQVDEHLYQFSADYWHEVRQELKSRFGEGLFVLAQCGAAGDQSPHFLLYGAQEEGMRKRRGVNERQEIALRVADAVSRALACTEPETGDTPFGHAVRTVDLAPRGVSKQERDWAAEECVRYSADNGSDSWWPQRLQMVVDQYEGRLTPGPHPTEVHVLRIGDAVIATSPFELFTDYGLRIKARSAAAQTIVAQIVGGTGWYLPTERAVEGGGYGAMPVVCKVGPEGGRQLVEVTLEMIGEVLKAPTVTG